MSLRGGTLPALLALVAAVAWASPASAQYFGRNKVRYESFDFQVLKTEHFDIYHYPEEREATARAARMAERWYTRLSRLLDHRFNARQPLILYANHAHFQQTNALLSEVGEGTGGATELLKRRIVMPFAGPLSETDHVLGHELVHAFQFDITSGGRGGPGNLPSAIRLPLWFIEGMAEYLSVGPVDPHTATWMRDAAAADRLPAVDDLNDPEFFPYRYGQALWSYVAGRWGDQAVGRVLKATARTPDAERALEETLGVDMETLSRDWHASIRQAYAPLLESKQAATRYGRALITARNAGELNVGPSLSPDGNQIVFLSEKGLFAIEMFLADTDSGEVRRKIVQRAADPHFDSLQFIQSSGSWDPRGRRFVFAALRKGQPVLSILDVERAHVEREIEFEELGQINDPVWSPDGRRIAFSANVGGVLDLFVYDLQQGTLRRLTDDPFAQMQPSWSPDGRRLVFATDRFTSRLAELEFGEFRLALMEVESGTVRELPGFAGAKNIDPQWAPDGRSIYFLSDQNGISNVYRLELPGESLHQVTDLLTGVTGITDLSPALSAGGGGLAFSVYEKGHHNIYFAEDPAILAGRPPVDEPVRAAVLPPLEREGQEVRPLIQDATLGLPEERSFPSAEYDAGLSLDYIGQSAGVTIGADPLGTYVGGGVSFLFSDMLGNHNVGALVQASGELEDLGFLVAYENRKSRWTWGGAVEQIPFRTGRFSAGLVNLEGQTVFVEQADIFREIHRTATGYAAYPFSRAQRLELSATARNISFDLEQLQRIFDPVSGQLLAEGERDLEAPAGLTLGEVGAALVYDSSVFGATGPILGRRYRLEASPTFGDIQFTGVLADFRQYVMPVRPLTVAARLLHYGRYGSGGEEGRLRPLFIGYPNLVRGYDVGSFDAEECPASEDGSCPVFDQLVGSRLLVGNLELRVPLFGLFDRRNLYGPIPIELFTFGDAGVAWTSGQEASFLGGDREPVASVGFGARVNVFGFAVVEVDYVRPLDRPRKGWHWQFNFTPGF